MKRQLNWTYIIFPGQGQGTGRFRHRSIGNLCSGQRNLISEVGLPTMVKSLPGTRKSYFVEEGEDGSQT